MFIQYNFCHLLTLLTKLHKKLVKHEKKTCKRMTNDSSYTMSTFSNRIEIYL